MSNANTDLFEFIIAETSKLSAQYDNIQRRVKEDPGTAGDRGEGNWAEIFRKWVPAEYAVETKGRIIGHQGIGSPQVDVVILHPSYPPELRKEKLWLAGGVVAAFECKLTLDSQDITRTMENCAKIKRITAKRLGTPYRELHSPLTYGLLAHSHSWNKPNSTPIENITEQLKNKDEVTTKHPRDILDVVCVADLATWTVTKLPHFPDFSQSQPKTAWMANKCLTGFVPYYRATNANPKLTPMAILLLTLYKRLAWEDERLRRFAEYLNLSLTNQLVGDPGLNARAWEPNDVYSPQVMNEINRGRLTMPPTPATYGMWDEWRLYDCYSSIDD